MTPCAAHRTWWWIGATVLAALWGAGSAAAQRTAPAADFLLISDRLTVEPVLLVEASERGITARTGAGSLLELPLARCAGLLRPMPRPEAPRKGVLQLADGQRLPGDAVSAAADPDVLVWSHALLGRLSIDLPRIDWVRFVAEAPLPPPGEADVLLLTNGDRLDGLIVSVGDPMALEVRSGGQTRRVEVQRDRVLAARMVARRSIPQGQRVWLSDGSVIDVRRFEVGDDRIARLIEPSVLGGGRVERVQLSHIAAVQFNVVDLSPLAALSPQRIEGPATRRFVPPPLVSGWPWPPLGLADIELHGPLLVRYALPRSPMRFAAEVEMPTAARRWGDCELTIRDDDREVFRARLSAQQPAAVINVRLTGSALTIELTEGGNGPIQDHVVLTRAMLLAEPPAVQPR